MQSRFYVETIRIKIELFRKFFGVDTTTEFNRNKSRKD
jgi:hypothetical protein